MSHSADQFKMIKNKFVMETHEMVGRDANRFEKSAEKKGSNSAKKELLVPLDPTSVFAEDLVNNAPAHQ